jgi:hypothetical protein
MKTIDPADFITPFKLFQLVRRSLPPAVAAHEIRKKWLDREIRFWVRWLPERLYPPKPGDVPSHEDETAPPQFLRDLEGRGIGFTYLIGSEDGIRFEQGKMAYLFASRADAARFWPLHDQDGSMRVTGRKAAGAPPGYDWEAALVEAARYTWENGLPRSQAKLVSYILEWFGESGPSDTQVKEHIGPLYAALRDASPKASSRASGK